MELGTSSNTPECVLRWARPNTDLCCAAGSEFRFPRSPSRPPEKQTFPRSRLGQERSSQLSPQSAA